MVDIVAPIVPYGKYVYVGGLGDAFCRVSSTSGIKTWCLNIGVGVPFADCECKYRGFFLNHQIF